MPYPLSSRIPDSIKAKIDRANENIEVLDDELSPFFEKHGYRVVLDPERDSTQPSFRIGEPVIDPAPSFNRFSVLAGEIVYHLRSSLDQLIWELIRRNGNAPDAFVRPRPEFPIFQRPEEYEASGRGKINGISVPAKALVFESQPFYGGHNWPLWNVHHLNIVDKHRLLNTIAGWVTIRFRHNGARHTVTCEIKGRTVQFRASVNGEMDMEIKPTFHVSLSESGITECEDIMVALRLMAMHVWAVILKFEGEFK